MKAERRSSIKDDRQNKSLKLLLFRTPFAPRQYWVRRNGAAGPQDRRAVSLTRLLTGLRRVLAAAVAMFKRESVLFRT